MYSLIYFRRFISDRQRLELFNFEQFCGGGKATRTLIRLERSLRMRLASESITAIRVTVWVIGNVHHRLGNQDQLEVCPRSEAQAQVTVHGLNFKLTWVQVQVRPSCQSLALSRPGLGARRHYQANLDQSCWYENDPRFCTKIIPGSIPSSRGSGRPASAAVLDFFPVFLPTGRGSKCIRKNQSDLPSFLKSDFGYTPTFHTLLVPVDFPNPKCWAKGQTKGCAFQ